MSQLICLTPTPFAQGIACLHSKFRKSVFIAQQLAGGRGHVYSWPPCAAPSSGTTMTFRARNSMSYATDFVWDSLLPSAPVNRAQGRKRSRDNATTIGLFPFRHGKGPYGPGSHYREGTHHQPFGGGSWRLGRRVSTRSSAKFASSVARLYDGTRELATSGVTLVTASSTFLVAAGQRARLGYNTYSNLDISGTSTGIMYMTQFVLESSRVTLATVSRSYPWSLRQRRREPTTNRSVVFPAIEEERHPEEQRLVRFERRQGGYRGNGQYQQFGRARHPQCAVLLGYEEVKNTTNAENFTKYDEAAFRAAVSADPEFRYCMSTTCKSGQCHPAGIDEPTFCCRECGHNHCVSCEANWHEGLTCAQYQDTLQRAQEEEESQQEVAKSSTFVGSKLKTSRGTSSLCRALLSQYDRGTSFAIEEERQHEPSGGIASPGNDTSTGFLPLSPSSNINQFTSFGGFGGGGAVAQINNGHFPAGMDMSVWSNISSSVEPTTSSSTKAHIGSNTKELTTSSSTKAHIVSSTREPITNRKVVLPSARPS
ncbi:hypothetical protein D6C92_08777 [Aureobasidium pullulans]|nr:hypothetical protein D6C92_08777 [Aureobasidium pullulans]